jgi:hypothetical protein
MSFLFVPRSVSRTKSAAVNSFSSRNTAITAPFAQTVAQDSIISPEHVTIIPVQDILLLVNVAFSDYAVWETPSLRDPNRDGCAFHIKVTQSCSMLNFHLVAALSTILESSPILMDASISEANIVKAVRACAPNSYDVRMTIASSNSRHAGGYEIRRTDWQSAATSLALADAAYWRARTLYMVSSSLSTKLTSSGITSRT